MKFAYGASANGRGQMRERQRRDREAMANMRTSYPKLSSLRLEFDFSDAGPFTPAPQVTVLHPAARAYFVFPCPYSDCDGEFDLSSPVTGMIRNEEMHCEGQLNCSGHRNRDGKGRTRCELMLEFQVQASET